jgi:hypothetical protein
MLKYTWTGGSEICQLNDSPQNVFFAHNTSKRKETMWNSRGFPSLRDYA